MKILESAENYLEAIHIISQEKGYCRSIDIANRLGFSKPSVSVAMKNLREHGYIVVVEEGHLELTEQGKEIALSVYEKHEFLTSWLIHLGVDPVIAADDACRMEHVISQETFEAMKLHCKTC